MLSNNKRIADSLSVSVNNDDTSKGNKRTKTTITTTTTIVTEDVGTSTDTTLSMPQTSLSTTAANKAQLLQQLQLLQNQLQSISEQLSAESQPHLQHSTNAKVAQGNGSLYHDPQHVAHPSSQHPTQQPHRQPGLPPMVPQQRQPQRPTVPATQPSQQQQGTSAPSLIGISSNQQVDERGVMERGTIYFFYRPRVITTEVHGIDDVQRFFILLKPHVSQQHQSPFYRLIRIGKKKLPSVRDRNRFWGIVEEATEDWNKIDILLSTQQYSTVTLGDRTLQSCRPVGEGVYALVMNHGFSHLAYVLEVPQGIGEAQQALNIEKEGSFLITVKNPQANNNLPNQPAASVAYTYQQQQSTQNAPQYQPSQIQSQQQASQDIQNMPGLPNRITYNIPQSPIQVQYPENIQRIFQGRRFIAVTDVRMLDYKGVEVVVIGETNNLVAEFGKIGEEMEEEAEEHELHAQELDDSDGAIFAELKLNKKEHPVEPLLFGQWK